VGSHEHSNKSLAAVKCKNFLTSLGTVSYSRMSLYHGVSFCWWCWTLPPHYSQNQLKFWNLECLNMVFALSCPYFGMLEISRGWQE